MSMSDERAVEVGQFSQPSPMQPEAELAGYFEPTQVADLTRQGRLLVVADGVGGAASGDLAARYAVQKILHDFYHSHEPDLEKRLLAVIRQTNRSILERNQRFPERRPVATTLLAALIHQNKLLVASVGDGRAYVVWDQDIEQLTSGNGSPQRQARETEAANESTPAEAPPEAKESSPPDASEEAAKTSAEAAKSRLLAEKETTPPDSTTLSLVPLSPRSPAPPRPCPLGLTEQIEIELFSRRLFAGDIVVLCGGGLTGYVTETEIAQTVTQHSPDPASRRLVEMATKRGCRDTLAIGVTRVLTKPVTQAPPARQSLPLAPDWDSLTKTSTRPVSPVTARPVGLSQTQTPRRWPFYAAIAGALLFFSIIGFLVGAYWLSPSSASPEAALSQKAGVQDQNQAETLPQEFMPGGVNGQTSPVATAQSGGAAQVQPTPTSAGTPVAQSNSPLPTPTESVALQAGDVITPTPRRPQPAPVPTIAVPAGCTNKGRFAGDVTVRDGTEFAPGEPFEKVWSVTNYGTCPWGGGYTVRFANGDLMGAVENMPVVEVVVPEATGLITVAMVAPDLPGTYRGNWQMVGLDGEPFGPELYLEIQVMPGILPVDEARATTLYDFVANAAQAQWSAGDEPYSVVEAPIDRNLIIPDPQGIVVIGPAEFRGDTTSPHVLMTHPHLELGIIEGTYQVDTPLQPTDVIIGSLGLPKAAAINDDGVTFEMSFRPTQGPDQLLFSKSVKYEDTPVPIRQALTTIQSGQTGAFTLRVKGGDSLSYDWATWIELRLVRP